MFSLLHFLLLAILRTEFPVMEYAMASEGVEPVFQSMHNNLKSRVRLLMTVRWRSSFSVWNSGGCELVFNRCESCVDWLARY